MLHVFIDINFKSCNNKKKTNVEFNYQHRIVLFFLFSFFIFRLAFYEFINNEDVRCLYVFNRPPKQIIASLIPPHELKYKSIFFLKCNAGTKLTKENIGKKESLITISHVITAFKA